MPSDSDTNQTCYNDMQKEQIDRFVTLASLQMPALVSQPLFQGAEIFEDYALLTFPFAQDLLDGGTSR